MRQIEGVPDETSQVPVISQAETAVPIVDTNIKLSNLPTTPIPIVKKILPSSLLRNPTPEEPTTEEEPNFVEEELVPLRIDLSVDGVRITDTLLWNLYGNYLF